MCRRGSWVGEATRRARVRWVGIVGVLVAVAAAPLASARAADDPGVYRPIRRLTVPENGGGFGRALATVGARLLVGAPNEAQGASDPHAFLVDPGTGAVILDVVVDAEDASPRELSVGALGTDFLVGIALGAPGDDAGGLVRLFDGDSGALRQSFCCGGALALGVDGKVVIAGEGGGGVFDPATGDLLRTLTVADPNRNGVQAVATLGRTVALAARNPVGITLFDVRSGRAVGFLGTNHGNARQFGYALAVDGARLAVSERPQVYVFDLGFGLVLGHVDDPGHQTGAHFFASALAWTADALVVGSPALRDPARPTSDGGAVYVFDGITGALAATLAGDDPAAAFGIAVAALGRSIAVGAPGDEAGSVVVFAPCGDGVVDAPVELCDDGNLEDGDGCDADCRPTTTEQCGDADGDGAATLTDGVHALRAAALLPSPCTAARCDVDGNGSVTLVDAVQMLRGAAGFPMTGTCAAP